MRQLFAALTVAVLLLTSLPLTASALTADERREIVALRQQQRSALVAAVVAARQACGRDRQCRRAALREFFIVRARARRTARRQCSNDQLCTLRIINGMPTSMPVIAPPVAAPVTPPVAPPPIATLSAAERSKFDNLFARHRRAWGSAIAGLLPTDLPPMPKQQWDGGINLTVNEDSNDQKFAIDANFTLKADIGHPNNPLLWLKGSIEAAIPDFGSGILSAETKLIRKVVYSRIIDLQTDSAFANDLEEKIGQWFKYDLSDADINWAELFTQKFPQREIRQLFAEIRYLQPQEYLGRDGNFERYRVTFDAGDMLTKLERSLRKGGVPAEVRRKMMLDFHREFAHVELRGVIGFDRRRPQYFVFDGVLVNNNSGNLNISANFTASRKTLTLNDFNASMQLNIETPRRGESTTTLRVGKRGREFEAMLLTISPQHITAQFNDESNGDAVPLATLELTKRRANWVGTFTANDFSAVIHGLRLRNDGIFIDADIVVDDTNISILLDWQLSKLHRLQLTAPRDAIDVADF